MKKIYLLLLIVLWPFFAWGQSSIDVLEGETISKSTLNITDTQFTKKGKGTLELQDDNSFKYGMILESGIIIPRKNKSFDECNLTIGYNNVEKRGWLTVPAEGEGTIGIKDNLEIKNHFIIEPDGMLTFDIPSSKVLKIHSVDYSQNELPAGDPDNAKISAGGAIRSIHNEVNEANETNINFMGKGSLHFENNTAGYGGAIGYKNFLPSWLDFTNLESFQLKDNEARLSGGGIYLESTLEAYINFPEKTLISGNKADMEGGAIFISSGDSNVELAGKSHITGNKASNEGGAFFILGSAALSVGGNVLFSNNTASHGGAIFQHQGSITLTATDGPIAFTGNMEKENDLGENFIPNAIYLHAASITLNGDRPIYFNDPIRSEGFVTFTQNNSSVVQFGGANEITGDASISDGIFRILPNSNFSVGTAKFTASSTSVLAGGGTITAKDILVSGIISPDAETLAIPNFNSEEYEFNTPNLTISENKKIGTLSFKGDLTLEDSKINIDLGENNTCDNVYIDGAIEVKSGCIIEIVNKKPGEFVLMEASETIEALPEQFSLIFKQPLEAHEEATLALESKTITLTVTTKTEEKEYYTIAMEIAPGIDLLSYATGNYVMEEGSHLHLQFLPEVAGMNASDITFRIDGVDTPFQMIGGEGNYYSYILNPVESDHTVFIALKEPPITFPHIEGITFSCGEGTQKITYGDPFLFEITLDKEYNESQIIVKANGNILESYIPEMPELRMDLPDDTRYYRIDQVTGPLAITVEGVTRNEPVANLNVETERIRLYSQQGQLVIETICPEEIRVYNVTGTLQTKCMVNGYQAIDLQRGIYIVKTSVLTEKIVISQ